MEELKEYLRLNSSLCDRLKTANWGRWMQKNGISVLTQGHDEGVLIDYGSSSQPLPLSTEFQKILQSTAA
jgi:hypothetical protein